MDHNGLTSADDPGFARQSPGLDERNAVVTTVHKGEFLKPCPGTTAGYLCCGYRILTPLTGCGMYCDYCILQTYLETRNQVIFSNFHDLEAEVRRKLSAAAGIVRIGTGEFADSLFLESRSHACRNVARLLSEYPDVLVEFKTKSVCIEPLREIKRPEVVVIGFSMNTERMIALHERGTASLAQRLAAAAQCEQMGFRLAFHFDPMFWYRQWESEYRELVRAIFSVVRNSDSIAWWSLGGFRTVPSLKSRLRNEGRYLPLFSGEMHRGSDGKLRYFRPIRTAFYQAMREEIEHHCRDTVLYLCMESVDVWRDSGLLARIPRGLPARLDERAAIILGRGAV